MAYPTRGAWEFENLSRDFAFWPRLESIQITQEHPNMVASASFDVVDEDAVHVFQVRDECIARFAGEPIWAGRLATVEQTQTDEHGSRLWVITGKDYTADMTRVIVRRRKKRKREMARRRLRWLLTYLTRRYPLAGRDLDDVPDERVDAYDYYGQTVAEAIAQVCDEVNAHAYIDLDHIFRIYTTGTVAAPFTLDNAGPDLVDSFPFREFTYTLDEQDMANAVLVQPEKRRHSRWTKDSTSIAQYGRLERFHSDENIHRRRQVRRIGERQVAQDKDPDDEMRLVTFEPGLQAGMTVSVAEGVWGIATSKLIRQLDITAIDPHDEAGEAYLQSEATLTSKRKRRLRGRGRGPDREGEDGRGRDRRRRHGGQSADVDPYILDSFSRTVEQPPVTEGASLTLSAAYWKMTVGQAASQFTGTLGGATYVGPGALIPPALTASSPIRRAQSVAGAYNHSWPTVPCGRGAGAWSGWTEVEQWVDLLLVPTHPGNMVGIYVDVDFGAGFRGVGANGGVVRVYDTAPTDVRQGHIVGYGTPGETVTVFIDSQYVPDAGGRLWIGVGPDWEADYDMEWACAVGFHPPVYSGAHNSGRFDVDGVNNARWAVASSALVDFGETTAPRKSPWAGDTWDWRLIGIEGSPDYGIDGNALFVEDGGLGLALFGEREDDDEPYGIWSDLGWAIELEFELTALVSDVTAGVRHIELSTIGEMEKVVGTIHLGDPGNPEGIGIAAPVTTDHAAKTFTEDEKWLAVFDTRSDKLRGKTWRALDKEPCAWDVECAMDETEDDQDRVVLWLRAGSGQRIRVTRIRAMAEANEGQRVVREFCGYASGVEKHFTTRHPFREGTLRVHVNGIGLPPATEDGDEAEYGLSFYPTAGAPIRNTYITDQHNGEDDD